MLFEKFKNKTPSKTTRYTVAISLSIAMLDNIGKYDSTYW